MLKTDNFITTKEFITMLLKSYKGNLNLEETNKNLLSGHIDKPIQRRMVARILHDVLLTQLKEEDEKDWAAAEDLSDLYSCRTCVMHIAQVYVKGIMDGRSEGGKKIFDLEGKMIAKEANTVVERTLDKNKRTPRVKSRESKIINISLDQGRKLMSDEKAILVDLRSNEEYQREHIPGSINIPFIDISKNPYCLYEYRDRPIMLYCQRGYKSSLGANLLIEAGYSGIYNIIK